MKKILLVAALLFAIQSYAQTAFRGRLPRHTIKLPQVQQTTDYTCGPTSLLSILRYFGKAANATEMSLAQELHTSTETGTYFKDLQKALEQRGLGGEVEINSTLESLRGHLHSGRPAILNYQFGGGHYAVAMGMDGGFIYLMDPWFNRYVRIKEQEFFARWNDTQYGPQGAEPYTRLMVIARPASR